MSVQERRIETLKGLVLHTVDFNPFAAMTTPKISQIRDPIDFGELSQTAVDVTRYYDLVSDR